MRFMQSLFNRLQGLVMLIVGLAFSSREFPFNIIGILVILVGGFVIFTGVNPRHLEMGVVGRSQHKTNKKYPLSQEEQEEKIKKAGEKGEKDLAYALNWLDKNRFRTFKNIKLSDGGESQEFDSIVVGDKAVFNIETKNYIGDLTIDEEGNWYRVINDRKSGMESPVFQVRRHNKVLSNILQETVPIVDLIVWANVNSVIEGSKNSPVKVIKVDQLMHYLETFDGGRYLSKDERNFVIENIQKEEMAI